MSELTPNYEVTGLRNGYTSVFSDRKWFSNEWKQTEFANFIFLQKKWNKEAERSENVKKA
jgi:hypothetical protein